MAFRTLNRTMDGTANQITAKHTPVKWVNIFNVTGNSAVKVGDKNITATIYGFSIAAAANGPAIGPLAGEQSFNLDDIWLLGTNGDVIRVSYLT